MGSCASANPKDLTSRQLADLAEKAAKPEAVVKIIRDNDIDARTALEIVDDEEVLLEITGGRRLDLKKVTAAVKHFQEYCAAFDRTGDHAAEISPLGGGVSSPIAKPTVEVHFLNLLPEIVTNCLSPLSVAAIGRAACTSSQFKSLAYHDDVWQRKVGRLLSTVPATPGCPLREYFRDATWQSGNAQAIQMMDSWVPFSGVAVKGSGVVLPSFTVEFMIRQFGRNSHKPICMHTNHDWSRGWAIYFQSDPCILKFFVGDGFVAGRQISMPMQLSREWTHVCASFDGSCIRLYKDGVLKAHQNNARGDMVRPASINDDLPTQLLLGGGFYHTWRYVFAGQIAEFRLWRGARSAEEIQASAFCFVGRTEPALMCYFRFGRQDRRTVEDLSAAGNHGQMEACEYHPLTPDAPVTEVAGRQAERISRQRMSDLTHMRPQQQFRPPHRLSREVAELRGEDAMTMMQFVMAQLHEEDED